MDTRNKIITLDQAADLSARLRAAGRQLTLAAGFFEVLQAAHARFFDRIRRDGAVVLAAVYDDASLCHLLGRKKPILDEQARAQMVAALAAVDYVLIWQRPDLDPLREHLRPDRVEHAGAGEHNIIEEVLNRHK